MSATRRSAIWNVFTETHKSDYIATCNICYQEFSYRSTTTNLMKHLKRKHPDVAVDLNAGPEKQKEVEIVIERQLENTSEVESYKVEVMKATEQEVDDYTVLCSAKKLSPVWDFFTKVSDSAATCNYCCKHFDYKFNNVTLMENHLAQEHFRHIVTEIPQADPPNITQEVNYTQEIIHTQELVTQNITANIIHQQNNTHFDIIPALQPIEKLGEPKETPQQEKISVPTKNPTEPDGIDDNFWNLDDNYNDDSDFRPSPEPTDEKEAKQPRKRSQIWNVFTDKPDAEYVAICNVCHLEFCYRSTTNNLKKHFERKHPNISLDTVLPPVQPESESQKTQDEHCSNDEQGGKEESVSPEKQGNRKPSQIWKYFTRKKKGQYIATCNICKKELAYKSTTSNLKKHLHRKHPYIQLVKTELEEEPPKEPEVPVKTCLICLENDSEGPKEFIQVNNNSEDSHYVNKIQEIINQTVVIDESHVLCQTCINDIEKVIEFKAKIMKSFEFWSSKAVPKLETEEHSDQDYETCADDVPQSEYSDLEDGESLAKFTCSKCQNVFPSPSVMLKHNCDHKPKPLIIKKDSKDVNENKFYCEHCRKGFGTKWKLTKHLKNCPHPKFTCSLCNRIFKKAYHLREHMASHTGERNYSCNICGKTFQRSSSKHKHMRSHNAKPGEKSKKTPFLCTICGKSFPYSNGASRHMRVHLGEKRHECHICSRKFSQTTHLKVHLRTHSGERPYGCMICGRTFSLNASVRKHMRLHMGSTEFMKLMRNMESNIDGNLETIDNHMEENIDGNLSVQLEQELKNADVVTEDGMLVLTHEIAIDRRGSTN